MAAKKERKEKERKRVGKAGRERQREKEKEIRSHSLESSAFCQLGQLHEEGWTRRRQEDDNDYRRLSFFLSSSLPLACAYLRCLMHIYCNGGREDGESVEENGVERERKKRKKKKQRCVCNCLFVCVGLLRANRELGGIRELLSGPLRLPFLPLTAVPRHSCHGGSMPHRTGR